MSVTDEYLENNETYVAQSFAPLGTAAIGIEVLEAQPELSAPRPRIEPAQERGEEGGLPRAGDRQGKVDRRHYAGAVPAA